MRREGGEAQHLVHPWLQRELFKRRHRQRRLHQAEGWPEASAPLRLLPQSHSLLSSRPYILTPPSYSPSLLPPSYLVDLGLWAANEPRVLQDGGAVVLIISPQPAGGFDNQKLIDQIGCERWLRPERCQTACRGQEGRGRARVGGERARVGRGRARVGRGKASMRRGRHVKQMTREREVFRESRGCLKVGGWLPDVCVRAYMRVDPPLMVGR